MTVQMMAYPAHCASIWASVSVRYGLAAAHSQLSGNSRPGQSRASIAAASAPVPSVSPDEAEQGQSTVPRMVGEAEGVAVVNRR